jgi:hypothetical protein
MLKEYIVADILHSGRKGLRGEQVDNPKYKGLIGYKVKFDPSELVQFKCLYLRVLNSPDYEWWRMSETLEAALDKRDGTLTVETANSIYIFKEVSDATEQN